MSVWIHVQGRQLELMVREIRIELRYTVLRRIPASGIELECTELRCLAASGITYV